ncbi:DUF302 domain-containing protein [Aliidongia dinghuensis]|nr:DUF302 domain-containing protein [Aliidongia dinghuensis]
MRVFRLGVPVLFGLLAFAARSASAQSAPSNGLVTLQSHHTVLETIDRFEAAVRGRGWTIFTVIDHAAAAKAVGLTLRPRSVIVFGQPERGTDAMRSNPTLAIDLPMKALIWQDDEDKVWLTYNSADYIVTDIYPRHGLSIPPAARDGMNQVFREFARQATD